MHMDVWMDGWKKGWDGARWINGWMGWLVQACGSGMKCQGLGHERAEELSRVLNSHLEGPSAGRGDSWAWVAGEGRVRDGSWLLSLRGVVT